MVLALPILPAAALHAAGMTMTTIGIPTAKPV